MKIHGKVYLIKWVENYSVSYHVHVLSLKEENKSLWNRNKNNQSIKMNHWLSKKRELVG